MARVPMPLPSRDFDPSDAAIPWKILKARGHAPGDAHTMALAFEAMLKSAA